MFLDRETYAIYGFVQFTPVTPKAERERLLPEAQRELLSGIVRQSELGRDNGARIICVSIDGDRELAGFFRLHPEGLHRSLVA
jgi:hypothetical protein